LALVSKKRGRRSTRRLPDATRSEVLGVVRERYGDFGPTLAHEKLTELHGVTVSVETLREWMVSDGLGVPQCSCGPRAARGLMWLPVSPAWAGRNSLLDRASVR
jgi:hypothetical protein